MSPSTAHSPEAKDDTEVLSRRTGPGRGEAPDAVKEVPEGETSTDGHMGEQIPMETSEEVHIQFGPQPNTIPETRTASESSKHPPSRVGDVPTPPVALSNQGHRIT